MSQPASNLRVRRTKILLREALITLIEAQGFDAITVGQLTEQAMVSRAAFYRHYHDKYDLVEQIFEEAMSMLFEAIRERVVGQEHPADVWVRFWEHIAQYDRLYRALLGDKGSPWFVRKMRARLAELIKERHGPMQAAHAAHLPTPAHPAHRFSDTFVPDLIAAMFVEAITWWLAQGQPYPPKELATKTALLASAVFRQASTWS